MLAAAATATSHSKLLGVSAWVLASCEVPKLLEARSGDMGLQSGKEDKEGRQKQRKGQKRYLVCIVLYMTSCHRTQPPLALQTSEC